MKTIRLTFVFLLLYTLLAGCDASDLGAHQPPDVPSGMDDRFFSDGPVLTIAKKLTVGTSRIARGSDRIGMQLTTTNIPVGHAITIWWVVFNRPEACASSPCTGADLMNPETQADVLYADGAFVDGQSSSYSAVLFENDTTGSVADIMKLPAASGLLAAETAEIHLVARSHSAAIPELGDEQINTFGGGCGVELTGGEMPDSIGECANIQFTIHQPAL